MIRKGPTNNEPNYLSVDSSTYAFGDIQKHYKPSFQYAILKDYCYDFNPVRRGPNHFHKKVLL